jgi:tetratricopeptide (TPR) repeat protein
MRKGQWQSAADSLRKAIDRDSTFGSAWYELLRSGWWGGAETGAGAGDFNFLIRGATRDSSRLPRRSRLVLRAIQAADRGERLSALRRADELLSAFPDDPGAVLAAADNYFHYGLSSGESPTQVVAALERAVALDSSVPEARVHLIELYCLLEDSTRAWRALTKQLEVTPDWADIRLLGIAMRAVFRAEDPRTLVNQISDNDISVHGGLLPNNSEFCSDAHPARAIAIADSFTAFVASSDRSRTLNVTATARRHDFYMAKGQYRAAWDVLQKAAAIESDRFEVLGRVILHHLIVGNKSQEAEEAAQGLAGRDGSPIILLLWLRTVAGVFDSADSERLYGKSFLMREDMTPYRTALLAGLGGLKSLRAGDSASARQLLLRAYESRYPSTIASPWAKPDRRFTLALARLEFAVGDLGAALRHLHDMLLPLGTLERAEAEELRGQIEEQRGDTAAAVHAYRNFIGLWENADPELQPRVTAAREALARLEHR